MPHRQPRSVLRRWGRSAYHMTTHRRCGKTYTWDELREVSKAEAADLPPGTWRDGKFDFNDYLIESVLVGTIEEVDTDDDDDDD